MKNELNPPQDELLTVPESAAFLRLKPSTIRAWILKRRIQYVKLGGRVFIRRSDLDKKILSSLVPARDAHLPRPAGVDLQ